LIIQLSTPVDLKDSNSLSSKIKSSNYLSESIYILPLLVEIVREKKIDDDFFIKLLYDIEIFFLFLFNI
jgi:hypothetical protein